MTVLDFHSTKTVKNWVLKEKVLKQIEKFYADYSLLPENLKLRVLNKFKNETDELLEDIYI